MEKISSVVRGNSRVATADNKNAQTVRPGAPSYGQPVGVSTSSPPQRSTTAERAVALHKGMKEAKEAVSQERALSKMADDFFMSRVRTPEELVAGLKGPEAKGPDMAAAPVASVDEDVRSTDELVLAPDTQAPPEQREYTPRGSYVDVRA